MEKWIVAYTVADDCHHCFLQRETQQLNTMSWHVRHETAWGTIGVNNNLFIKLDVSCASHGSILSPRGACGAQKCYKEIPGARKPSHKWCPGARFSSYNMRTLLRGTVFDSQGANPPQNYAGLWIRTAVFTTKHASRDADQLIIYVRELILDRIK